MSKIMVVNLSWQTTDDTLRTAFSEYGQIPEAYVMRDRDTGRSRGSGFITYLTEEEAQMALRSMHDQEFEDRRIHVSIHGQNSSHSRGPGGMGGPPGYGGD